MTTGTLNPDPHARAHTHKPLHLKWMHTASTGISCVSSYMSVTHLLT